MAGQPLYEVEKLLDRKVLPNKRVVYLVRWRGFSPEHDSWEPYANLQRCKRLVRILNRTLRESNTNSQSEQSPRMNEQSSKMNLTTFNKDAIDEKLPAHKRGRKKVLSIIKVRGLIKKAVKKPGKNARKSKYPVLIESNELGAKLDAGKMLILSENTEKVSEMDVTKQTDKDVVKPGRKGIKRQKFETPVSGKVSNITKKKKKLNDENIHQQKVKNFEDATHTVVNGDISSVGVNEDTNNVGFNVEDDDDSDILYSLNLDCDIANLGDVKNVSKNKKKTAKMRNNTAQPRSPIVKNGIKMPSLKNSKKDGGKRKAKMSLLDSKKKPKDLQTKSGVMRSASPPPIFTTVKHLMASPDGEQDPSKPSGNCHEEPISPEASETYLADVPSSYPVPAEEPHARGQSPSPRSISYNSLLDNLPEQLHPSHKGSKKNKNDSSNNCVGGSSTGSISPVDASATTSLGGEQVERRTSVRSTECAFRYKQIVVKKCVHYTQIWLNTQTVMKNALNPQVIQEVVSALNSAKYDDSHLVLFSSLGNVFCSGTDLHFLVSGDRKMSARQMADAIRELTKTVITFPKPIIAAVSGAAVGMGVSLLALCDVVYASDKASFHLPYSQLSQTPEGCSSFTLPLTLGLPSANELLFGGRKITAMEAYQLGLVSQVFWPTLMMQEVIPRAQNMATCSAKALEATKLLVRSHHRTKMELTNETECNLLLERWLSVDCQRAIEAYLSNEKNLAF